MATLEDDGDMFRRRVQQKMAEQYAGDLNKDHSNSNLNTSGNDGAPAAKQSPFCVQNFLWLGAAVAVFYFSDFMRVVAYDLRIKSAWFWIGVLFMSVHVGIAMFLVLYMTVWKNISSDVWEQKYPKLIPIATAAFILGLICLSVGLWPVWGFLTPFILLILFMGAVVIIAMIG